MTTQPEPDPFGGGAGSAGGPSGPRAGFFRRLGAYLLDGIVLSLVSIPFAVADASLYYGVSALLGIAYFSYLEGGPKGQTLGKMALGIRVIDLGRGGSIGYGRAVVRYVGRFLSAIVLLLGYLWMLWDSEKQTWHDKLAGSVVVPTSSYPVG